MKYFNYLTSIVLLLFFSLARLQAQVNVTFRVNMSNQTVSSNGVHLAGSIQGWDPSTTEMLDADADGVYEVTVAALAGATHQYKFINGNDWPQAESVPQACGVNDGFGSFNRNLVLGTNDTTLSIVCFGACENCAPVVPQDSVNVTFRMNMSNQTVSSNGVHLAGSIQGWDPSTTEMLDADADGVYEVTVAALAGATHQYKFINGNDWPQAESVPQACGVNDGFGSFNRNLVLGSNDTTLSIVCFGACENCATVVPQDSVNVTFRVNMSIQTVSSNGVHLAGSIQGWDPSTTEMLDADADGVYEVTVTALAGATHQYKFINGNDWPMTEVVPQTCGVNDGFGSFNRNLVLGTNDTTLSIVCFGACENCAPVVPQDSVNVTFRVNMSNQTVSSNGVHLAGSIQGWDPSTTEMLDADADGVYEVTVTALAGATHQYKFINGNDWPQSESVPQACGQDDGFGAYNRQIILDSIDTVLPIVCFSSCENCTYIIDSVDVTFLVNMANETISGEGVFLRMNTSEVLTPMALTQAMIYEVTLTMEAGQDVAYRFVNGNNDETVPTNCSIDSMRFASVSFSNQTLSTVCLGEYANCGSIQVTLHVNMREQQFTSNAVFAAGNFSDWIPVPMADTNQDSIYTLSIDAIPFDNVVYKFVNGAQWESVPQECGLPDGNNLNRVLETGEYDVDVPAVCFGSCTDCAASPVVADTINVTFKVNMQNQVISADGVHLAGSIQEWNPSTTLMNDLDGDSIYEVTLPLVSGEAVQFKFINGIDWSNAEIVPSICGVNDGNGGYNRYMLAGENSNVYGPVCFGECANCGDTLPAIDSVSITFLVNMSNVVVDNNGIHLAGNIQGWNPATTEMTDLDADGIYEVVLNAPVGSEILFKFINGNDWPMTEAVPQTCGVNDGFGNFNRQVLVPFTDVVFGPVCFAECNDCSGNGGDGVDVTFQVNMTNQTISTMGVHLAGSIQGWNPASTEMLDLDGDGVYTVTLNVPANSQFSYKFINGNDWPMAETVPQLCGVSDGFGGYNRQYTIGSSATSIPVVCFGECTDCGGVSNVNVTFNVNMSNQIISPLGVHLAGNIQGWDPATTEMLDNDGDGTYSVTLMVPANTDMIYKFINGNDWPLSEIVPAECGVDDGFGGFNRSFPAGSNDINIQVVCFNECADCSSSGMVDVTFRVNIAYIDLDSAGAFIAGSFNSYTPMAMTVESDSVYVYTTSLPINSLVQFKFLNGPTGWESVPFECGVDDTQGGYNRQISIDETDIQLNPICFATCTDCGQVGLDDVPNSTIAVYPNPTSGMIALMRKSNSMEQLEIIDAMGRIVFTSAISGYIEYLDLSHLSDGLYFLDVGNNSLYKIVKY